MPVEPADVLRRVADLPVATWNYKTQDPSIRHMGPMAQDLYAAFGLGESDTGIDTIDADGIALAAIQGLNKKLEAEIRGRDEKIAKLESEVGELKAMVTKLAAGK